MKLAFIFTLLFVTQTTFANESLLTKLSASSDPTCYGREYSIDHLKSHSQQTVQKIQAKFEHEKQYDTRWLSLEVTLKGEEKKFVNYRAMFIYFADTNTWAIECDGGRITADLNKEGNLVIKNEGFVLEGGCGSEDETLFLKSIAGGDDVFELVPLPQAFCQKTLNL